MSDNSECKGLHKAVLTPCTNAVVGTVIETGAILNGVQVTDADVKTSVKLFLATLLHQFHC